MSTNRNEMTMTFDSLSKNEGLARMVVTAFLSGLNPTLEEIADVKTAVSEAVTNAILHGYQNGPGKVALRCLLEERHFTVEVEDKGIGIADIEKAKEPLYTTRPEWERSGMGFVFMETFMDALTVTSEPGGGTLIHMEKEIGGAGSLD